MSAPWFKFYPVQFLTDSKVKMLSRDHRSILVDLWCYCSEDGGIPSSIDDISRLIGESKQTTQKAMAKLAPFFVEEGGRFVSERMNAEAKAYEDKCQKLRQSASKGGAQKVANAKANASEESKQMLKQNPTEVEREIEKEKEVQPPLPPSGSGPAAEAVKPKKPTKPKGRDFSIAALDMPPTVAAEFDRVWTSYPKEGWNFSTKRPAPRRINYAEAAKRFFEVIQFCGVKTSEGRPIGPDELADATLAWVANRVREARRDNSEIPNVPCIANFFSSVEGSKHHWKEALLEHFEALPVAS